MSKDINNSEVVSLGCRLNIYESEVIKNNLKDLNIQNKIVVNTCCVTQNAERQSLALIRKMKKLNPNKDIIVTGCAVHTALDKLKLMTEVSQIVDNSKKFETQPFLTKALRSKVNLEITNPQVNPTKQKVANNIPKLVAFTDKTRAFIQIQQGCNHRCSFCIIHQARGKSVSISQDEVIEQIHKVVNQGHQEVILTGVDISSWQRNIFSNEESKIGNLCFNILKNVKKLKRLRLSSLDPAVTDHYVEKMLADEPRFMPSLHLSLQSMSNAVLNNMGRRHSKESASDWISKLRDANKYVVLGADFICGFPRETHEQFLETYEAVKKLNIQLLHVFPYSERSGTPAASMTQVLLNIRKERTLQLIALGQQLKNQLFANKLGSTQEVLIEGRNSGYTKDYCLVKVQGDPITKNSLINLKINDFQDSYLSGQI